MTALPRLLPEETLLSTTKAYLNALKEAGFSGDIEISYGSRLAVATDNSIYQKLPQAVILPRNVHDMSLATSISQAYEGLTFSARGGGTGTNGQSLTPGIVLDTSRYLNKIVELNLAEKWVKVECGVVKDALNDYLRPHGYFFSPDLSTSNRATCGGMINTDASGQGSLVYGKTSDHVLALTSVLANGEVIHTQSMPLKQARLQATEDNTVGKILNQVIASCVDKRQQIIEKFPRLNRFLTGYDLEHAYDDKANTVDLSRLIAGSEGSLAFVAEAKLNITAIPKHTALVNIKYDKFESALRHAPSMIAANATSVETVDSRVLNLAKQDIVWHSVSEYITEVPNCEMLGLNMVEYNNESQIDIEEKIAQLSARLDNDIAHKQSGVIGYQVTYSSAAIKQIYGMRKKAVGLLGKIQGKQKPIAFAEDTAVPPENLADFIMEFRELLDSYGLQYGMFGHVDAGVLHVRPALDMCDPEQEKLMKTISDQVVALVAKYGGLMWGEHGKGYRSEYAPAFFGDELYTELQKIKRAFDPLNQMNPGKICTPFQSNHQLVAVTDVKRGTLDRTIPIAYKTEFDAAMSCNGNGLCFNYDTTSPMCPSSKITKDRRHSPKGRAGLIREWLRLLGQHELSNRSDTQSLSYKSFNASFISKWRNSRRNEDDFSHEVLDAMNGCLACKSCSSQCPVGVDVPDFRSKFLSIYYQRYTRPLKDYLVANVEKIAPLMAMFPTLSNILLKLGVTKWVIENSIGYVDAPLLSVPNLASRTKALEFDLSYLEGLSFEQRAKHVLIVQDPFTSFYDADTVEATVTFARKIGLTPIILPFHPNGKAQHVKGFLDKFENNAKNTSAFLNKIAKLGIVMIGVDASLVLCYRDEYSKILGEARGTFSVLNLSEWMNVLPAFELAAPSEFISSEFHLLAHCTEKTALPLSERDWVNIFHKVGLTLKIIPVGCCGMAGTYGHELENLGNSKGIYDLSWSQHAQQHKQKNMKMLATGYSCRSQVKRFDSFRPSHPIEVLAMLS